MFSKLKTPRKIPLREVGVHSSLFSKACKFTKNEPLHGYFSKILPRFQSISYHLITGASFNGCFGIYIFQWLPQPQTNSIESIVGIKETPIEHEIILFSFQCTQFQYSGNHHFQGKLVSQSVISAAVDAHSLISLKMQFLFENSISPTFTAEMTCHS